MLDNRSRRDKVQESMMRRSDRFTQAGDVAGLAIVYQQPYPKYINAVYRETNEMNVSLVAARKKIVMLRSAVQTPDETVWSFRASDI
jgi:hypothetical protein